MKQLREERKSRKIVQTRGLHKAQERRDIGAERKREAKKKKQENEEKRRQQARERQRRLSEKKRKEKDTSGEANREESSPEEDATVFPSRMAKKRVKDKVTSVFPKSPRKKAAIIQEMARSPITRKILEKKGILKSPEEELETTALRSLAEDLAEGLSKVKKAKTSDERAAYTAARSLAFGQSVKSKRQQCRVAKLVNVKRKRVSEGISRRQKVLKGEEASWLATKRSMRLDSVKEEDKRAVYDYWTQTASRPTGSKKDTVKKRIGKGKYVVHAKHVLEKTQSECFLEFQQLHPEIKIKQRKFEQLKPFFMKSARERDRQSCLCRKHVECKIIFDACMNYEGCENSAMVDGWQEVRLTRDGEVTTTRQRSETAGGDRVNALTDLIEDNSIVAIAAEEDNHFDYYLLKVISSGAVVLESDESDDYGIAYPMGSYVLKGHFFLRDNIIDATYKLDSKIAMVYANTVRAICGELRIIKRRRETLFKLSPAQHEEIMSCF